MWWALSIKLEDTLGNPSNACLLVGSSKEAVLAAFDARLKKKYRPVGASLFWWTR